MSGLLRCLVFYLVVSARVVILWCVVWCCVVLCCVDLCCVALCCVFFDLMTWALSPMGVRLYQFLRELLRVSDLLRSSHFLMPPVQRRLQMVSAPPSRSLPQPADGTLQASVPSEDFIHEPHLVEARMPTQCWEIKEIPKARLSSHIHRRPRSGG